MGRRAVGQRNLPELEVLLVERPMPGLRIEPVTGRDGEWAVQVPIPAEVLTDGVQTFLI